MKRAERHHLKENELKHLAQQARDAYGARRRELSWVLAAVVIMAVAAVGYFGYREYVHARAGTLLAEAMAVQDARIGPPPAPGTVTAAPYFPTERERFQAALARFKAAADAYPSTDDGIYARYKEAAIQMTLGSFSAAATAYQQVIDRAGSGIHGDMARLGLAEAQAQSGQYDQAISTFKELAQKSDGLLPVDGILMELGRAYRDAGKSGDAQQTFNRIVSEFPDSPFNADAKRELESLKKT